MKKCGIYIIKNNINQKVYVGQSVDIMCRWYAHKYSAKGTSQDSYTKLHTAMNDLGVENFYIEVLEECDYEQLSNKEIYWIEKCNSYNNGYNMTLGGEKNIGETNGRAILKEEQVIEIRMAYNEHIQFKEVYKKYQDIISKRGLQKVWWNETWKHILQEVYTDENRIWHKTAAKANVNGNKEFGENNAQRACSEEEILEMRRLRQEGLSYQKIGDKMNRSSSVVRKYCLFEECDKSNKIHNSIQIKNIETGLVFDSMTQAGKWAKSSLNTISKWKDTTHSAGFVPTTGEPAHWKTL